ncbi:MAG: PIG-L family deacetylase [Christensenellaceae bacterium]|nr:PIG-L family deacetylase [Christensenellaceae bacterium]
MNPKAEIVNGGQTTVTEMCVAAHQDDVELMCPQGIVRAYEKEGKGFAAVIVADGGGSPRAGAFANYTDEEMKLVRQGEQKEAAKIGKYARLALLNFSSKEIKAQANSEPTKDILALLKEYKPEVLYIHNLADKHPTHCAVALRTIEAVRKLPMEERPKKLYGCEVWRGLDWLSDSEKVTFNLTGKEKLLRDVLAVHKSQIAGGKRYDLAAEGRRVANATYAESHGVDTAKSVAYCMDLTALIKFDDLSPLSYILSKVDKLKEEITANLK